VCSGCRDVMRHFRSIDHTADAGVAVKGGRLEELFQNAALAFTSMITDLRRIRKKQEREITLEAPGLEELLVAWLGEFLYLFDTEGWLLRECRVRRIEGGVLDAIAWGEPYEEGRHTIKTLVKAVTYHQLEVRQEQGLWRAQIIFDI
jgi:SHS2 domain-containing protein